MVTGTRLNIAARVRKPGKKEISKGNLQPLCVLVGGLRVAGCGC